MADLERQMIFGVPFIVGDLETVSSCFVRYAIETDEPKLVAHADVHVLTRILHDADDYGRGLQRFACICPDGMPIVWLMRRKGADAHRLYGPDMMEWMWDKGRAAGLRHYLIGGSEEAFAKLTQRLAARFPGVQVVGHTCPPMGAWPEGTTEAMLRDVREKGANCVWVGLGCPKQERWMFDNLEKLPPALYFGVGAAFNFHAGLVRQAPLWIRSHGLEWFYRLCKEPRRLFKRYLVHNTRFLWYCLTRKV